MIFLKKYCYLLLFISCYFKKNSEKKYSPGEPYYNIIFLKNNYGIKNNINTKIEKVYAETDTGYQSKIYTYQYATDNIKIPLLMHHDKVTYYFEVREDNSKKLHKFILILSYNLQLKMDLNQINMQLNQLKIENCFYVHSKDKYTIKALLSYYDSDAKHKVTSKKYKNSNLSDETTIEIILP